MAVENRRGLQRNSADRSLWSRLRNADLRYGARMLAKSPGFTLIAILTLAWESALVVLAAAAFAAGCVPAQCAWIR